MIIANVNILLTIILPACNIVSDHSGELQSVRAHRTYLTSCTFLIAARMLARSVPDQRVNVL